jgi:hypothetical protein
LSLFLSGDVFCYLASFAGRTFTALSAIPVRQLPERFSLGALLFLGQLVLSSAD